MGNTHGPPNRMRMTTVQPNPGVAPYWTTYFNDDSFQSVREVMAALGGYNIDGKAGLNWYCTNDPQGIHGCRPGIWGYAPPIGEKRFRYVTLCDRYLDATWASTVCDVPGSPNPTFGTVSQWQQPIDQAVTIFHEMLHDNTVAGLNGIDDGPSAEDQNQYTYNPIVDSAKNAATNGDGPLKTAQSFTMYAQYLWHQANPGVPCQGCPLKPTDGSCNKLPNSVACRPCG